MTGTNLISSKTVTVGFKLPEIKLNAHACRKNHSSPVKTFDLLALEGAGP